MRTYETVTIVKPQLSDAEVAEFVTGAKELISASNGEVVSEEKLGRRKFSHEINHVRDGFYLYIKFNAEPKFIKTWEESMKLNENVLRSIVMLAVTVKARPAKADKKAAA
ncbi:small subunit ribosomal protein S6 [Parelusimicrobium proximum]|uniref:30S ribosomal protein S6 n=1 Tax=Parelusimicrobium proximum TaxID=3228953 RepID=UPI003D17618F